MHNRRTIIWDTIVITLMADLKNTQIVFLYVIGHWSYIIFLTILSLNILSEDCDVIISVRSHLCVHDPKQVEHLMKQSSPVLCPTLSPVCQFVRTVQDHLLVPWRLCIDCCTEPRLALLDTRCTAVNLDLKMMTFNMECKINSILY